MHDVLWKELAKWINRMPAEAQELFEWQHDYVRMRYEPESWFARARTSTKENTEAIAGVHADDVLIVVDEASGVPEQVFNTAEGAMTSGNVFIILIGNPVRTIGYFFDTHHRNADDWQLFGFDGEESPIVDKAYVAQQEKRHGRTSNEFGIRVSGTFPATDLMDTTGYVQLIPRSRVTVQPRMVIPGITDLFSGFIGRKILGVDPAGEGKDKATYVLRDRFRAEKIFERATSNPREIAGDALTFIDRFKLDASDVVVDAFGVGSDVGKEIAIASQGKLSVYTPLVGNKPAEEESYNALFFQRRPDELQNSEAKQNDWDDLYLNLRALMYFRAMRWIITGGVIVDASVDNSDFANELVVIKYKRTLHGNRIQLMPKPEMLKLGIPSPNIADAFALTFLRDLDDASDIQTPDERERNAQASERLTDEERFSAV